MSKDKKQEETEITKEPEAVPDCMRETMEITEDGLMQKVNEDTPEDKLIPPSPHTPAI